MFPRERARRGGRSLAAALPLALGGCLYEVPEPDAAPGGETTVVAVADSYVWDGDQAALNFGAEPDLTVKDGSAGYLRHAFVRFDIPPEVGTASRATLRLAVRHLPNGVPVTVSASAVSDDGWDELAVSWNAPPGGISLDELATSTLSDGSPIELDVSAFVSSELARGDHRVTLNVYSDRAENRAACFYSREGGHQHGPRLVLSP